MILIGIGAKARQGKNFVANYMKAEADRYVRIDPLLVSKTKLYAFADELKLYCKEHHDELVPKWQLTHQTKQLPGFKEDPIYGCTPILQWYGTNVARKSDPDTWVKALANRLINEGPEIAIVTDVRFPNEAAYIKEKGGHLIEVIRQGKDGEQYLDPGRDPKHESETALDEYDGWDFVIVAKDGDLKGLKAKSVGVYNLISKPEDYLDEAYFVDEPDYSQAVLDSIDSDGTGFKE